MRVGVVGGTGTLGALAVAELARRGHEVWALSRSPPASGAGVAHRVVDLASGEGVAHAVSGLDVVVDASNVSRPGRAMRAVLLDGTRRLMRAEAEAGVAHHVLVSIVGIEEVPLSYYRVKLEQERAVREGPVTASVLRSTQFHPLVHRMFEATSRFGILPAGGALLQPVDPQEVARVLAEHLSAEPWSERVQVAGPEILSLSELAHSWRTVTGRRRVLMAMPLPGRMGRSLRRGALTTQEAIRGQLGFADWLAGRAHQAPQASTVDKMP